MNLCVMLGRLTRDFDVRHVGPNKDLLGRAGLAITTRHQENVETCFIEIEVWGRLAEVMIRNLKKGDPVMIRGRLRLNQWKDEGTGKHIRMHAIRVESWSNVVGDHDELPDPDQVPTNKPVWETGDPG